MFALAFRFNLSHSPYRKLACMQVRFESVFQPNNDSHSYVWTMTTIVLVILRVFSEHGQSMTANVAKSNPGDLIRPG